MARIWQVWAHVIDWYDGDTFYGWVDLGCHVYIGNRDHPVRFRCARINAPELNTAAGPAAATFAGTLAPEGDYAATSTGLDNYGRPLIDLHLPDGRLFSAAMMDSGHAVAYRS